MRLNLSIPTIILARDTSGFPIILTAAPTDGTPHIVLTKLDLTVGFHGDCCFGFVDDDFILIAKSQDGAISHIGRAIHGRDGELHFVPVQIEQMGSGKLCLTELETGVLAADDVPLTLDPRLVAMAITQVIEPDTLDLIAKTEGSELTFGTVNHIGAGTQVKAEFVNIAGKTFIIATELKAGIMLVVEVRCSGNTWCATGTIGHVDHGAPGAIADVTPSELAAFNFGTSAQPVSAAVASQPVEQTAAAVA